MAAPSPLESFGPPEIQHHEIELHQVLGQGASSDSPPFLCSSDRTRLGAFGTVWLGSCRAIDVAVKVPVNSRRITPKQLEAFQAEVKIMRYANATSHIGFLLVVLRELFFRMLIFIVCHSSNDALFYKIFCSRHRACGLPLFYVHSFCFNIYQFTIELFISKRHPTARSFIPMLRSSWAPALPARIKSGSSRSS